jgi:hypothetical protein
MSNLEFYDLMSIDPLQWGRDCDPIGLLTYQNHKRKKQFYVEEVEELNEALTLQQRMKRKIIMRRLAPRLARARKIAMRKRGGTDVIKRRATSLARRTMAKKLLGGRNKGDVSPSERARVEKILAKRKTAVGRLATKLMPIVRKKQAARFAVKKPAPHKPTPTNKPTPAKPAPAIQHKPTPVIQHKPTAPVAPASPSK